MLEVILDTETTGLSTSEKHRIVEIGCVELNNQISTLNLTIQPPNIIQDAGIERIVTVSVWSKTTPMVNWLFDIPIKVEAVKSVQFTLDSELNKIIPDSINNFEDKMMYMDSISYLPDDILCKVDRSSMFYSLEARSPLLSKSLVEYMFKLPLKYKIKNGITKSIPKKLLSKYLPKEYIYKPKQGFGIPLAEWFRGDLKSYVFDNLSKEVCDQHLLFNITEINKTLKDHFQNNINSEYKLWSLIQFNLWYKKTYNK